MHRDFFSVADNLALLSPAVLDDLRREATRLGANPGQLVLQKGLLEASQVDIIETMLRPNDIVPGYELLGVLGQGGMGVVYQARQLALNRIVALKTVLVSHMGHSTVLERFEREAQAVAQLTHPNIVAAYDFGRHEGRLYFAMELVQGQDVGKLIDRHGMLDEWTVWGIVRQAAAGLAHAAAHGIVHRDIKPANLLLVEPPTGVPHPAGLPLVKIADFGLAQLAATADERTRLTSTNVTVGSPSYMSPEQLLGEPVDLRTDMFALGATAFHMLTGRPPQAGMTLAQIVTQRIGSEVESVHKYRPEVGQHSAELVAAMMVHDPRQRLASYGDLTRRIDALGLVSPKNVPTLEFGAPTGAAPWTPTKSLALARGRLRRLTSRAWLAIGLIALVAIALLVGVVFHDRSPGSRDLKSTGRVEELFNGQSINQWQPVVGVWSQAKNNEGALVLQGRGLVRRPFFGRTDAGEPRPLKHYRLTLLVDLHEASSAEVQFDLAGNNDDESCAFVRVDRQLSTLGKRLGAQGARSSSTAQRPHSSDSETIHAIEIERHSQGWWTFVDGRFLGSLPFLHDAPAAEFRLLADGGFAWFSDFTVEELESPSRRP